VSTHVNFQITRLTKSFITNIALVRSLSLRSFPKSSFFFSYLFVHRIFFFFFFFETLSALL